MVFQYEAILHLTSAPREKFFFHLVEKLKIEKQKNYQDPFTQEWKQTSEVKTYQV